WCPWKAPTWRPCPSSSWCTHGLGWPLSRSPRRYGSSMRCPVTPRERFSNVDCASTDPDRARREPGELLHIRCARGQEQRIHAVRVLRRASTLRGKVLGRHHLTLPGGVCVDPVLLG